MKNLLWLSLRVPYDNVPHAGGKTHNYYIKSFNKTKKFNIKLLSFCYPNELKNIDLEQYSIENDISVIKRNELLRNTLGYLGLPISLFEYFYIKKEVHKKLRKLRKEGYEPDIIFMHWTEIVLMYSDIKNFFPRSKLVSLEEDVTFLKMRRKLDKAKSFKRIVTKIQQELIEKKELAGLNNSDLIVLNNYKDYNLVINNGIPRSKCFLSVPYFENMQNIERTPIPGKVIFWGAMNRPENIEAVLWFAQKVLPFLNDTEFIVIGANPPKELLSLEEIGVKITGYVDNPKEYFESCMCLVVPLQMGAGIKVKVLEGMSAGIPVLTNDIGIEGISAHRGKDYIHCETPDEYINSINMLNKSPVMVEEIGSNARKNISSLYSLTDSIQKFANKVEAL